MRDEFLVPEIPVPVPLTVAVRFYAEKLIPPAVIARKLGIKEERVRARVSALRHKHGLDIPSFRGSGNLTKSDAIYFREAGLK